MRISSMILILASSVFVNEKNHLQRFKICCTYVSSMNLAFSISTSFYRLIKNSFSIILVFGKLCKSFVDLKMKMRKYSRLLVNLIESNFEVILVKASRKFITS